jgi:hypothetical protein
MGYKIVPFACLSFVFTQLIASIIALAIIGATPTRARAIMDALLFTKYLLINNCVYDTSKV